MRGHPRSSPRGPPGAAPRGRGLGGQAGRRAGPSPHTAQPWGRGASPHGDPGISQGSGVSRAPPSRPGPPQPLQELPRPPARARAERTPAPPGLSALTSASRAVGSARPAPPALRPQLRLLRMSGRPCAAGTRSSRLDADASAQARRAGGAPVVGGARSPARGHGPRDTPREPEPGGRLSGKGAGHRLTPTLPGPRLMRWFRGRQGLGAASRSPAQPQSGRHRAYPCVPRVCPVPGLASNSPRPLPNAGGRNSNCCRPPCPGCFRFLCTKHGLKSGLGPPAVPIPTSPLPAQGT